MRAEVVAEFIGRLPARLVRRLDADTHLAAGWARLSDTDTLTVMAGDDATVVVSSSEGIVTRADQITCSCLLAPACLHVAAVLRTLPLDTDEPTSAVEEASREVEKAATASIRLTPQQIAAAESTARGMAHLLSVGATNAGLLIEAELLRAAQTCRSSSMARPAAAVLRTVRRIRDLHADRSEFSVGALIGDVADASTAVHEMLRSPNLVDPEVIGRARLAYESVGGLILTGLCSEPVVSAAGFAGVVTYLISTDGRIWTVPAVMPGDVADVAASYLGPARIGDVALAHRELGRAGLNVSGATASQDGRLGSGKGVKAATRLGSGWEEPVVASRFTVPLADQLAELSIGELLFVRGSVVGADRTALVITAEVDGRPLRITSPVEHDDLPGYANLRLLASARGLEVAVIGRMDSATPRTVRGIALTGDDLALPPSWRGTVNLGLDTLQRAQVPAAGDRPANVALPSTATTSPIEPLVRRLERGVLAGRAACGPLAAAGLSEDASRLRRVNMPAAAQLLSSLGESANDPTAFAAAWTSSAVYVNAVRQELRRGAWLEG
ncbi:MAG TPA: SWIM zinc finger family protein [Acidimicrobiales bacterium]|nr:SWIM zinc finger family protein [Acidimicrobiales bacterium]